MCCLFQLIISIPSHKLPKITCPCFAKETESADEDEMDGLDDGQDQVGGRGQILWVRGLTRLQQQVSASGQPCVVVSSTIYSLQCVDARKLLLNMISIVV